MYILATSLFGTIWFIFSFQYFRDIVLDWLGVTAEWIEKSLSIVLFALFLVFSFIQVKTDSFAILPLWVGAAIFGFCRELWSYETIQYWIINGLERSLAIIFSIGFAVFTTLLIYNTWNKGLPNQILCCDITPQPPLQPTPIPKPIPKPVPENSLKGRVVHKDKNHQLVAIVDAKIRVGQHEATSDTNGEFLISLSSTPSDDTLISVSDDKYISRFFRYDDPIIKRNEPIELMEKMRIIVLNGSNNDAFNLASNFINKLEFYLKDSDQIERLTDNNFRNEITKQLNSYQQGRGLYDKETLQQVGDFHGATHGLFWTVEQKGSKYIIECKLLDFKTAVIKASAFVTENDLNDIDTIASSLINSLLFDLADIKILSPKTETKTGHQLTVEGYALYRPKNAPIYIALLPKGSAKHFPQDEITVNADGSWIASVYVGKDEYVAKPEKIRINAVLIDAETTKQFKDYLEKKDYSGLKLDTTTNKIKSHIDVIRDDNDILKR
jgi:hypothetical protein